jgi:acetyl esterase/lipase
MASVRTEHVTIPVAEGTAQIAARVYRPAEHAADLPICVHYHSGGWASGDLDTEDGSLFCGDGVDGRALSNVVH